VTPDLERARRAVEEYLRAFGLDPAEPALDRTPERVARLGTELFAGVGVDPVPDLAASAVTGAAVDGPVAFLGIPFRSTCEHHLLKFAGTVSIVYLPGSIAGLGAIVRVIETIASRPQVQERFTDEVAFALETGLDAVGVMVSAIAEHDCVAVRGPRIRGASVRTLASRGVYATEPRAAEARALAGLG
jgi:GTP cyclohydrolase I